MTTKAAKRNARTARSQKTILIVDDHPMMREGLAQLISNEPDLTVCGQAETAFQAMEAILALKPDLVLLDITLPDKSGLELIKDMHAMHANQPVLVISMHDESLYAEHVLRAGALGYIMKQEGGQKLMQAIRQVLTGQIYVSEKMSAKILKIFSGRRSESNESPLAQLTDREFEVFQLIGGWKGTREIAEHLHISVKTVEVHRANIKHKLKLRTAPELIRFAVSWVETQNTG